MNDPEWKSDHELALARDKADSAAKKLEIAATADLEWPVGEGADQLDLVTKTFRLNILRKILSKARPLAVADDFREFMEVPGVRKLTNSSHLLALLKPLSALEFANIKKEFSTGYLSSIFDAAGHHGDFLANLLRKTEGFIIRQRLVGFRHSDVVFDHSSLNQCLVDLATEVGYISALNRLKAFCHDAAAVNLLSAEQARKLFFDLFDMVCASHIMQRVGERFSAELVDKLIAAWFKLFKNGTNKISLWRKITGLKFPSYNPIKWHSRFNLANYLLENFGSLVRFVSDDQIYKMVKDVKKRSKTVDVLAELVSNPALKVELAAYVDFSAELVNSTYSIEGDGPAAFTASFYIARAYSHIEKFTTDVVPWASAPNVRAVVQSIGIENLPTLHGTLRDIVRPALDYFIKQKSKHPKFFEFLDIASSFCPWAAESLSLESLNQLFSVKVLSYNELALCIQELDNYKILAKGSVLCDNPINSLEFTKRTGKKNNLPEWKVWRWWYQAGGKDCKIKTLRSVAERLGLYQPTSAAAERVFSLFRHHVKSTNSNASAEYLKWQAILNYNSTVDPMEGIDLEKIVT